jgi:hypothetical protein
MLPDKSDILSRINSATLRASNLEDRISRRLSHGFLGKNQELWRLWKSRRLAAQSV